MIRVVVVAFAAGMGGVVGLVRSDDGGPAPQPRGGHVVIFGLVAVLPMFLAAVYGLTGVDLIAKVTRGRLELRR